MKLGKREETLVTIIEKFGLDRASLVRAALNQFLDRAVNDDGELVEQELCNVVDYARVVKAHGGGPGAILYAQVVENASLNEALSACT